MAADVLDLERIMKDLDMFIADNKSKNAKDAEHKSQPNLPTLILTNADGEQEYPNIPDGIQSKPAWNIQPNQPQNNRDDPNLPSNIPPIQSQNAKNTKRHQPQNDLNRRMSSDDNNEHGDVHSNRPKVIFTLGDGTKTSSRDDLDQQDQPDIVNDRPHQPIEYVPPYQEDLSDGNNDTNSTEHIRLTDIHSPESFEGDVLEGPLDPTLLHVDSSLDTDMLCEAEPDEDNDDDKKPWEKRRKSSLMVKLFPIRRDSMDMYHKKPTETLDKVESDVFIPGDLSDGEELGNVKVLSNSGESPQPILKKRHSLARINTIFKESLLSMLSGIYAMVIVVLGLVLPISEVFAIQKHPNLFEGFYVYLYTVSIIFLMYIYLFLLREKSLNYKDGLHRGLIKSLSSKKFPTTKRRKRKISMRGHDGSNTGSFYLRLGAVAFGIGSMIQSGLQFGEYFELDQHSPCNSILFAIRPICSMTFTFFQLYYIFMNSKMCINKFRLVARFGLMHMIATNLCVWFSNIVEETIRELHEHRDEIGTDVSLHASYNYVSEKDLHGIDTADTAHNMNISLDGNHGNHTSLSGAIVCIRTELLGHVIEISGPFLYPCSIEYSLISAGILYVMWKNIGRHVTRHKSDDDEDDEKASSHRMSVDCSHSSKGLFLGIFIFVGSIISMIIFFMLAGVETGDTARLVEHISEIIMYIISSAVVIIGYIKMRFLRYNPGQGMDLEEVLIPFSLVGEFVYGLFTIMAASFDQDSHGNKWLLVSSVFAIIQAILQTMFIMNSLRRRAYKPEHEKKKPGREYVMFLLIINIAMWGINTFEIQKWESNPIQIHYYGPIAWDIFMHIAIPLSIFFRFHSTVCLSNIWKNTWKLKHCALV